jgi:hypothetical protein
MFSVQRVEEGTYHFRANIMGRANAIYKFDGSTASDLRKWSCNGMVQTRVVSVLPMKKFVIHVSSLPQDFNCLAILGKQPFGRK